MGPVEVPAEGCWVLGDRHPVLAGAWVAAQLGWPVGRPAAVEQAGVGWGAVQSPGGKNESNWLPRWA